MRGTNIFDSISGLYGRCLSQRGAWSLLISEGEDSDLLPHYGNINLVAAKKVKRNGCYLFAMLQHWKGDVYNPHVLRDVIQYLVDHQDPLNLIFEDASPGIVFWPERAMLALGHGNVTKNIFSSTFISMEMENAMKSNSEMLIAQTMYQATASGWELRSIPHFVYCYGSVGDVLLVDDPWRSDLVNSEMLISDNSLRVNTLRFLPVGFATDFRILRNLPGRLEWLEDSKV